MQLFWIKGYEGASISDLTKVMGIGSPSLYAAFGSKEALFLEAAQLYDVTEGSPNWRALQTATTAREAVQGVLMDSAVAFGRNDNPGGCLNVLSALNATDENEHVRSELRSKRLQCIEALEARLERAIAAGELSGEVDIRSVARFYVTVHQGMSIQSRDGASTETLIGIAQSAMSAWDRLTRPPGKSGKKTAERKVERDREKRALPKSIRNRKQSNDRSRSAPKNSCR